MCKRKYTTIYNLIMEQQIIQIYQKPKSWSVLENPFKVLIADVTHKCNMECNNCYIPNRDIADMDIDKLIEFAKQLPSRVELRIIGAEPTMRDDLPLLLSRLINETPHRIILLSNGLKFASKKYTTIIKNTGLKYLYLSINGVDNDHWYQDIDSMKCAKNKIMALKNVIAAGFVLDLGVILVKGINDSAPMKIIPWLKSLGMTKGLIRFKNVGPVGRWQASGDENFTLSEMITLCSDAWNIPAETIENSKDFGVGEEHETRFFSIDGSSSFRSGFWCKITDWTYIGAGNNTVRRGRITEDWRVAGFSEHVKFNEGGY